MEFLVVVLNLLSFFAGVLCVLAWYQAALPIYRQAPSVVLRVPLVIGVACLAVGLWQGRLTRPGPADELLVLLGATAAASFAMCFLYGWLRRGSLERSLATTRLGRFTPILYAWSVALLVMLVVTGVNSAKWGKAVPFWIQLSHHA